MIAIIITMIAAAAVVVMTVHEAVMLYKETRPRSSNNSSK